MNTLSNIAHKKNFSIVDTATISQAMDCMLKNKNGSVVVLNKKFPVGIVTESMLLKLLQDGICFDEKILPYAKKPVITAHYNRPVELAFELVVTNNIRRLVLVDDAGKYAGTVRQEDLFSFLEEDVYKVDLKVRDLLNHDVNIVTVSPQTSLLDALKQMSALKIGSVIVAKATKAVGIVTEKDILNASYKHIDLNRPVESFMSSPVVSVAIDEAITTVMALMRKNSLRRVLVNNEQGEMYALLTNRDIFKHIKGNVARMLEIKLRHAKEIMDFLPEAIIEIYDTPKQQVIHWMNRKAYEYFGSEVVEKHPRFLFQESWKELYTALKKEKKIINFSVKI
uniref:CBS domain-containing protein n=1 Tax=Sulfurimonas sp. TaxID=2022749 RepID=UPI002636CF33